MRPLQDGVISDFDKTADMLKTFIERAMEQKKMRNYRVAVGVPTGVTEVEKRAVEEVVRQMGASEVYILEEPMGRSHRRGTSCGRNHRLHDSGYRRRNYGRGHHSPGGAW